MVFVFLWWGYVSQHKCPQDSSTLEQVSKSAFLRLNTIPSCVYIEHVLFIHSSMDIGFFHPLTIVNNAAMNTGVQISISDPAFNAFGIYPRIELMDYMVILFTF